MEKKNGGEGRASGNGFWALGAWKTIPVCLCYCYYHDEGRETEREAEGHGKQYEVVHVLKRIARPGGNEMIMAGPARLVLRRAESSKQSKANSLFCPRGRVRVVFRWWIYYG